MKITYFHRHPSCGFSIEKVFKTIADQLSKETVVNSVSVPSKHSMPWDIIKNSWHTYKNRNREGINHVTGHIHDVTLGLIRCKTVLTIHDLVFLDHVKNPIKRLYKWLFWLYIPIKLSDKVVCISTKTKNNILSHIKTDKLSVIGNPIDPMFEYSFKEFNKTKPVVLHIGTGWNKNLPRVIEALEGIDCHLRIVGKMPKKIHEQLKKSGLDYSNVHNLSDIEIKKEYVNCDIVSFPSEYEGFGMPIIEGQKTGRIVVASKIEPLIEVSGNAVIFVNPFEIESIQKGFIKAIHDDDFRTEKITMGQKNVKRFEVANIYQKYLKIYTRI